MTKARRILRFKPDAQQHRRGDQTEQAVSEDHMIIDVSKVSQSLRNPDDVVAREGLQRVHVKQYHYEAERLQFLLRVVWGPGYHGELHIKGQHNLVRAHEITMISTIDVTTKQRPVRGQERNQIVAIQMPDHKPEIQ